MLLSASPTSRRPPAITRRSSGSPLAPEGRTPARGRITGSSCSILPISNSSRASPAPTRRPRWSRPWRPCSRACPVRIGFALASDDLAADVAEAQARGVAVAGPYAGRLEGPDGSARGWQVAWVEDDPRLGMDAWRLPFLIQHDATGRARLERLARPDRLRPHPLGAARLVRVTVAAHSLAAALRAYALAFGLVPDVDDPDDMGEDAMLRARTARLPLPDGAIVLAEPLPASDAADVGPLARGLAAAGEGLYSVTIAVADLQAAVDSIRGRGVGVRVDERDGVLVAAYPDPAAAHGARVELTQM